MRKLALSLLLLSIISTLSSCNKDDETSGGSTDFETALVGKWVLNSATEDGMPYNLDDCIMMNFYDLRENKTALFAENGESGGSCVSFEAPGTWSVQGDILTTEVEGISEQETIKELTETTLTLEYIEDSVTYTDTYKKE